MALASEGFIAWRLEGPPSQKWGWVPGFQPQALQFDDSPTNSCVFHHRKSFDSPHRPSLPRSRGRDQSAAMAEPLPAALKIPEISRFINRANQLRSFKPAVAYWCASVPSAALQSL